MKRLDRILAIIDPTATAQPALDKATLLARRFGSTLELFICDFDPALSGQPYFDTQKLRQLREEFVSERVEFLEEMADDLRGTGIATETHVHWDNPVFHGIVRRVQESSPDLVVKDTHHHSVIRRTLLTNTDWNLIRTCPAPLLLAKPAKWHEPPRFLVALDPGHLGDKPAALDHDLLDAAELLSSRLGGEVDAVHAFFPAALLAAVTTIAGVPVMTGMSADEIVETERQRVAGMLRQIVGQHTLPAQRIRLEQGSAADVIPRVVERLGADVLVMGAVSRSRLQELFVGSTAERILEHISCDVLVVKPGDFVEKLPF
jgi:universal stress protein E